MIQSAGITIFVELTWNEVLLEIDIGRLSQAFPVTPPGVRVRTGRFGGLSYGRTVNLGIPSESKWALGSAMASAGLLASLHGPWALPAV